MTGRAPRRRALVLANRLPFPLDDGWKVRSFHMVRSIAEMADTTVVVFHPGEDEVLAAARRALGPGVRLETVLAPPAYSMPNLLRGLLTRVPVHVWNQSSAPLEARLAELERECPFDVCITEAIFMYPHMSRLRPSTVRIVDTHNIDSVTMSRYARTMPSFVRRLYARVTASRFRSFERRTFMEAALVWVCSEPERELLGRTLPGSNVRVVPNGVDTAAMAPSGRAAERGRLVFFGRLDYFPNVDGLEFFARDILPLIRRRRPDVELHVVGQAATETVRGLAATDSGVRLRGRVDDVRPVLEEAEVVVVPLRAGGGTRLKILEALSMARAVVSTPVGAEGLDLESGRDLLLADSAERFADAVVRLLEDATARRELGEHGRATVVARYDWSSIGALARNDVADALAIGGSGE